MRRLIILTLLLIALAGCGTDLYPSRGDQRPIVRSGSTGPQVGQRAPNFTVSDTLGNTLTLSSVLSSPTTSGVVLYFTMWCPTCVSDMDLIQYSIIPGHPDITFFAVDYVSATVSEARNAEIDYGFDGSGFIVLADTDRNILNKYNATMATTVVIDKSGVIRMNESFKSDRLQSVLATLQ